MSRRLTVDAVGKQIVYLARHGETDWNRLGRWQGHTDVELSAAGREQALALGERVRGLDIGCIHASDLLRARQTAEIVGRTIGVTALVADPDLRERAFGLFEGLTRDECAARFPQEWAHYRADTTRMPPGGEPSDRVIARMREAVFRAVAASARAVLVISHGGSIRSLLSSVTGEALPPMPNVGMFRVLVQVEDGQLAGVEWLG